MRSARRLALSLALAVTAAIFMSGTAFAASPGVVISQVYGAGGNANALYVNDYIELFNRGATDVVLDGYSVQYASATGTGNLGASSSQLAVLSGTLPAGGYYLVGLGSGGINGAPVQARSRSSIRPPASAATVARRHVVRRSLPTSSISSGTARVRAARTSSKARARRRL
jgi:hypothetical protein